MAEEGRQLRKKWEQEDSFRKAKSNLLGEEADTESNSSSVRSLFDHPTGPYTFCVSEEKKKIRGEK